RVDILIRCVRIQVPHGPETQPFLTFIIDFNEIELCTQALDHVLHLLSHHISTQMVRWTIILLNLIMARSSAYERHVYMADRPVELHHAGAYGHRRVFHVQEVFKEAAQGGWLQWTRLGGPLHTACSSLMGRRIESSAE